MDKKVDYKKLRDFRVDKDKTQKEMAAILNIVPSAYSRLERGESGIRLEQLEAIAEALGKNINQFMINKENNSNTQKIKNETQLLESIIRLQSTQVEMYLFLKYDTEYPEEIYPSFKIYINNEDSCFNPDSAVKKIKELIRKYEDCKVNPLEWYRKELYLSNDQNIGKEEVPNFQEYHPYFQTQHYKHFKNKKDDWLMTYVCEKGNYDFIYSIMYSGSVMVTPRSEEEAYRAFCDMISKESSILALFEYGLLQKSFFDNYWEKYIKQENSTPMSFKTKDGRLEIENVRRKMSDIFSRSNEYSQP